ncbi:YihY/virulence factor BrkB family protein [Zunongwangia sp.]|uniref:YihY/virulence factor BrkB family protein n=1 Tax=Zunongwangia sp. TaxID=1965325 RepID=UPI003AA96DAD
MMKALKFLGKLLVKAFKSWNSNEPYGRSATIAYYTLFSLPSLLIIVVSVAGYFVGRDAVQGTITEEIGKYIGANTAESVEDIISSAWLSGDSTLNVIFGFCVLLFGATGVFVQLKLAMNNIWNVAEKKSNFWNLLLDRAISFGMILVIGFLLLVSFIISAILSFIKNKLHFISPGLEGLLVEIINYAISFGVITVLFAAIFKILPNIKIAWKTTFRGALLTTFLFLLGEFILNVYFSNANPASVYGSASSVILILIWVYYSCMIMFFGAEFTVQYALAKNEKIEIGRNGEPAIYQEMDRLEEKKTRLKEDKKIIDRLKKNFNIRKRKTISESEKNQE